MKQSSEGNLSLGGTLVDLSALEKHLSLKRILIGTAILLFLVAWNRGVALLYAMDALIIAILVVAWSFPLFNIRNIDIDVSLPESANEGEDISIRINTKKTGLLNRYMIELWGDFPFSSKLVNSKCHSGMKLITSIGAEKEHIMQVPCDLRGYFTLESFKLKTGFPLGLQYSEKEVTLDTNKSSSILVCPTPLPILHFEIERDQNHSALHVETTPKAGGHDDYIGVREYRHGDSPRHIHWPGSAKRGELVVREFEHNCSTHLTIFLDLNQQSSVGEGKHNTLEYAVKITATLVKYAIEHNYSFSVTGMASKPFNISSSSHSIDTLYDALEALAWVQADGNQSFSQFVRSHVLKTRRGGTAVLFDNSGQVAALLPELQAQNYYPLVYRFSAESFLNNNPLPSYPRKIESNVMTQWDISSNCELQGLFS